VCMIFDLMQKNKNGKNFFLDTCFDYAFKIHGV